jgi:hypothetical protein
MGNVTQNILMPPVLALVFLVLGWPYARLASGGRPLNPVQKKMLLYGFWFVLGMGYLVLLASKLRLPDWMWAAMIIGWAIFLAALAWWRSTRASSL